MATPRMIFAVTMGFFSMCILSGCMLFPAAIVPGVSPFEQNMAQTDLPELAHRQDAIDIAARVGESLGYEVSLKTDDTVILLHETCEIKEQVTGEYQVIKIFVYKVRSAKNSDSPKSQDKDFERIFAKIAPMPYKDETVCLTVYGGGVYKAGRQEHVNQVMGEFKNKLLTMTSGPPPGGTW
jgi:hypothetical protein